MLKDVKIVIQEILKDFKNVELDEVSYGFDAPTDNQKEIQIDLFPKDYGESDHDVQRYFDDCIDIYHRVNAIVPNNVVHDIMLNNSWNFIYIIL